MRYAKKAPDVSDISCRPCRKRGVLQPVIVRPNCAPDGFEIVAGLPALHRREHRRRRTPRGEATRWTPNTSCCLAQSSIEGDDAAAIEASMIENMARLDADEVTQWESFTRLVKEGQQGR